MVKGMSCTILCRGLILLAFESNGNINCTGCILLIKLAVKFCCQAFYCCNYFFYILATRPTLSGEIKVTHRSTGSWPSIQYVQEAEFKITVKGGDPKPDKYEWTLPWGNKIVPGQRSGDYYAKHQTVSVSLRFLFQYYYLSLNPIA